MPAPAADTCQKVPLQEPKRLGELWLQAAPLGLGNIRPLRNVTTWWISLLPPLPGMFKMPTAFPVWFDKAAGNAKALSEASAYYSTMMKRRDCGGLCTSAAHATGAQPPHQGLPAAGSLCHRPQAAASSTGTWMCRLGMTRHISLVRAGTDLPALQRQQHLAPQQPRPCHPQGR
jgi:hypothetical protein